MPKNKTSSVIKSAIILTTIASSLLLINKQNNSSNRNTDTSMNDFSTYRNQSFIPATNLNSTGLVRVLLIGINYNNTRYQLNGCINDINNIYQRISFLLPNQVEYMIISDDTTLQPTKTNIINAIRWLTNDLRTGQNVLFYYSGHGERILDINRDEQTSYDSCICPISTNNNIEVISDDELRILLVDKIPTGSKCLAVVDCCYCGTVLDLKYLWQISNSNIISFTNNSNYNVTNGDVVLISACMDNQESVETFNPNTNKYAGVFSVAILNEIDGLTNNNITINLKNILVSTANYLKSKSYNQTPQISTGIYFDINNDWIL